MIFKRNNKSKKQEEGIQIQSLTYKEHGDTRSLWETTFGEDSKEFTDFYYNNKIADNSIWVARENEQILSMAQLNPYQIHLGAAIVPAHYIVGVATLEEYRRQGLMRTVLEAALQQMYDNQEPLTYLMPAKEEYYVGFDFVSVYYQNKGVLVGNNEETSLRCVNPSEKEMKELARFSEEILLEHYSVFAHRDYRYYEMLKTQFQAEHGEIVCVYDGNILVGYFFYGEYDSIEVMEPVCLPQYRSEFPSVLAKKFEGFEKEINVTAFDFLNEDDFKNIVTKPATMVRIVSLEKFVRYLTATSPIELIVKLEDSFIEQNNGIFSIHIGMHHSKVEAVEEIPEIMLTIRELSAICFYNEIPKSVIEKAEEHTLDKISKIIKFEPIFLNEFV
ncbi:GNAT family N-acetyltransferase [Konateibacter massiliensis]|uniref:GNAT family N-acetyltransferase n=1 Tax=Konateibacter massiliensis TaxID=2002841 RepID=UPI000C15F4A3|nr:GNAT family N-acetyltransferase [Konateibacter massiliensis]